jgi:ferredoxin
LDYDEFDDLPPPRNDDDDEGLFSRDVNGQLVRLDAPTREDLEVRFPVFIDGEEVSVPAAEPLTDAQGDIVQDREGKPIPRRTTIYDAAVELFTQTGRDLSGIPIPVLCHQPHMTPVAVCRVCAVLVGQEEDGRDGPGVKTERRLTPACQRAVKQGMHVFTRNFSLDAVPDGPHKQRYETSRRAIERGTGEVRLAAKVLTELLSADHLKLAPEPAPAGDLDQYNELRRLVDDQEASVTRFRAVELATPEKTHGPAVADADFPGHRPQDLRSSQVFLVDHTACVLCDRCVRACDEVQENHVIGRTYKGARAGIGFDLDVPMGKSTCVQCGECMVSCPTSAITFKPVFKVELRGIP